MQTRRDWLRASVGLGGLFIAPELMFSNQEIKRFRPRPFLKQVKLSSNENPYGPSESVQKSVVEAFNHGCRYPYEYSDALAVKLAKKHGVEPESIIITGGSTEGLKITGLTFTQGGGEIIAGEPTFLAMMTYAEQWGAKIKWVPVAEDKGYDLNGISDRINSNTKLIFLCNPNNPTGTVIPKNKLEDFCISASKKTIVFSDEAYYDFIQTPDYPSMDNLVRKGANIIVSKTFSKVYGLAGFRIGYLIAPPHLAKKIRPNVVAMSNVLAIAAADKALEDNDFYNFSLNKIAQGRKMITETLEELKLEHVPSNTNFVFFHSNKHIDVLGKLMLEKGIKIGRPFPPFYDWCRISIGTLPEVQAFNNAIKEVYQKG
ncbi:MAG: aminotransferase [Flavobacteriaceae bacterium]|nr:aminotransferase [Flavobacteriaceae bacterium]